MQTLSRRKIHTATKFLVHQNILPERYLSQLHRSQVSRYRNLNFGDYFGDELFRFSEGVLSIARQSARNDFDRRMVQGYFRLALAFRSAFMQASHFHKTLHGHRDEVVEAVQRVRKTIPVEDCARLLGLSVATLRVWIRQVRVRCSDSIINLCRKVHPHQLPGSEVAAMKKLLGGEQYRFWPLCSLYWHALRTGAVSMAISTWYKYAGLLNIRRLKPKRSKNYGKSICATKPNEYWHADVTYFKTADGLLHYIYSVVDNFSRFPLCVFLSTELSGNIRSETFRVALKTAIRYNPNLETINLVVDGGPENFNGKVDEFLKTVDHAPIHRIRALKDVAFSNSMAEAFFRTLKCHYLNHQEHPGTSQLDTNLQRDVEDYAAVRPHGALNGLTPLEAYTGKGPDLTILHRQMIEARKKRVEMNRKSSCPICQFI